MRHMAAKVWLLPTIPLAVQCRLLRCTGVDLDEMACCSEESLDSQTN